MEEIVEQLAQIISHWKMNHDDGTLKAALSNTLQSIEVLEKNKRFDSLIVQREEAIRYLYEQTKNYLPFSVSQNAVRWNDAEVLPDWHIILTNVETYYDYFAEALYEKAQQYKEKFIVPCTLIQCSNTCHVCDEWNDDLYYNLISKDLRCYNCHDQCLCINDIMQGFFLFLTTK